MAVKRAVSQIGLWIILGLLILGLAGFGVTSFGGSVRSVASVGETEIDVNAYGRALQTELRRIAEATGQPIGFAEAQAQGIDRAVLQRLLAEAALDEAARTAGISVGDAEVSARILEIPAFQGVDGTFDREGYAFMLDRNGLSVAEFEAQIRDELARGLLQSALTTGLRPQPAYADAIYDFIGESRDVTFAVLTEADLAAPVPEVDGAAVEAFHAENPDAFRLPERKAMTYAWITPAALRDGVEVDDAALRRAYEERIEEFVRPPRRMVDRLGFADEAAAQAAADAIAAGETSFDALLEDRGLQPDDVDLGIVEQADLDAAGAAVFALDDTGVVGPLPSSVGPALFRVNAILTAQETPFEEARATLRDAVAFDRAVEVIEAEIEPLNDLLAGGATLEEIAADSDLELGEIVWTGAETTGIAAYDAFRVAADSATPDDYPELDFLEDGGIFAVRVDEVRPSEVPPLDAVRDTARDLAQAQALRDALAAQADATVTALTEGASFAEAGFDETQTLTGLTRGSGVDALPGAALEAIFTMDEGEARVIGAGREVAILRLDRIAQPDPDAPQAAALKRSLAQQAGQSMAQDLLMAAARAVESRAGITVNQAALNAVHGQMQ